MKIAQIILLWIADHWDAIVWTGRFLLTLFGGAAAAWAAKAAEIFSSYAPFSWVMAGLIGALIVAAILSILAFFRAEVSRARFYRNSTPGDAINPLESEFSKKKVHARDLVTPTGMPLSGKTFTDCEFVGPGLIVFTNCNFGGGRPPSFGNVEFLSAGPSGKFMSYPNKAALDGATLNRCSFQNIILMFSPSDIVFLKKSIPKLPMLNG